MLFWDNVVAGGLVNYPNLILASDMKFTLSDAEIWGVKSRMDHMIHYFTNLLDSSNLVDLAPLHLGPTWRNGRPGSEGISKRIDRFLAPVHLIPLLNDFKSWIHPFEISDHYPICLEWHNNPRCHLYPFKFNRAWLTEKDFSEIVFSSWNTQLLGSMDPMSSLTCKLKRL